MGGVEGVANKFWTWLPIPATRVTRRVTKIRWWCFFALSQYERLDQTMVPASKMPSSGIGFLGSKPIGPSLGIHHSAVDAESANRRDMGFMRP